MRDGDDLIDPVQESGAGAGAPPAAPSGPDADRLLTRDFILLWLCGWANFLGLGAVNPLLPRFVRDELGRGDLAVGLVVGVFAVSAVAVRPSVGRWANRWGRRSVVIAGAAVTAVSLALHAVPNLGVLVLARLLTGAGQALYFTGAATMVTELSSDRRRGEAVSYFSIAVYLGTGAGPAIGESIASTWSIGWGFITAGALGVVALLLGFRLTETNTPVVEAADAPLKRINRVALVPGCVLALGMIASVAFGSFMPLRADELEMSGAARVYLVYAAVVILVRLFGARLPDVLGPSRCGTAATIVIAIGMTAMAASDGPWGLYVGALTLAIGISFLYPALMTLVVARTPVHERSSAVATFTMFFDIASGVGGLVMGSVAAGAGYRAAFGTAGAGALVGLALLRFIVLRKPTPAPEVA